MPRRRRTVRDSDRPLYMISVAAELAGMHPQTLRIYERRRLVQPQRSSGNTRLYSDADIERLRAIQQLTQDEGVNLAGVIRIMQLETEKARLLGEIEGLREEVERVELAIERRVAETHASYRAEIVLVPRGIIQRRT
jgi:MerR family transcriptional regulator/heat shock protein HspR